VGAILGCIFFEGSNQVSRLSIILLPRNLA
jgi:hypothetical protein